MDPSVSPRRGRHCHPHRYRHRFVVVVVVIVIEKDFSPLCATIADWHMSMVPVYPPPLERTCRPCRASLPAEDFVPRETFILDSSRNRRGLRPSCLQGYSPPSNTSRIRRRLVPNKVRREARSTRAVAPHRENADFIRICSIEGVDRAPFVSSSSSYSSIVAYTHARTRGV